MNYKELRPGESLHPFVKMFWQYDNQSLEEKCHTVLPDGYFDLIINIGQNGIRDIKLYGIFTKQMNVHIPSMTTILGITFKPLAADYIIQESIADILNGCKILDHEGWGVDGSLFNDLNTLVEHFTNYLVPRVNTDDRKIEIFKLLFDSLGEYKVEELSKKCFWSRRQINRYFTTRFGLSLKIYADILRCAASYKSISVGKLSPSLNYYDQSHFIKTVRKYTGSNPKTLYRNKDDRYLQFLTLPKT